MLRFRAANMGDVHTVLADLSEISTVEVIADCGGWWKALPKVTKLLTLPDSQTEALVDELGVAQAIFGHYPGISPRYRTTWFVFSRGFVVRGAAAALACCRRVRTLRAAYPNTCFQSRTASQHPDRARWFSLLGFHCAIVKLNGTRQYVLPELVSDSGAGGRYNPTNPQAS